MVSYEIYIRFVDGSKLILPGVTNYTWDFERGCLRVSINGYYQVFNLNSVMFVGRTFDLGEGVLHNG